MNCKGFCDSLHEYKAGGLSPQVRSDLEDHILDCTQCAALDAVAREITCREVADFLNEFVDGELEAGRRAVFERHLAICVECQNYLESYRATIRFGRAAFAGREDAPTGEVPARLVNAILAARQQAG